MIGAQQKVLEPVLPLSGQISSARCDVFVGAPSGRRRLGVLGVRRTERRAARRVPAGRCPSLRSPGVHRASSPAPTRARPASRRGATSSSRCSTATGRGSPGSRSSLPRVTLVPRRGAAFGATHGPAARRSVDVVVGKQRVGRVIAAVPFDAALLRRLTLAAGVPAGDRLVFRTDLPTTVTLGETRYHASGARLQGRVALVALAPSAGVEGAGNRLRDRVLLTGLITLGCLFLLVWFIAPVIAQGRLGRRQRDQAAPRPAPSRRGRPARRRGRDRAARGTRPPRRSRGSHAADLQGRPADEAIPGWAELREHIPVGGDRAPPRPCRSAGCGSRSRARASPTGSCTPSAT